jgi:thymidine kinase
MDATRGTLELIIGTMFSGKSTELIRRVNRYEIAGRKVQLFKPALDDRYTRDSISSHDGLTRRVEYVKSAREILERLDDATRVVGIDEVQFFESGIIDVCNGLADTGRTVVASGLLKDFRDEYFPFRDGGRDMSDLVLAADYMIYLKAICTFEENGEICGREATRVQRFIDGKVAPYDSPIIVVGGKEAYAPRCRDHFQAYGERARRARTLPLFPEQDEGARTHKEEEADGS